MKTSGAPSSLLEIHVSNSPGFKPLVDSNHWRVALMNFTPEHTPDNVTEFQRHDETDELFVLLSGRCILFVGEGEGSISQLYAQDLQPFTLYNVKRGSWHTHVLSPEAKLVIVENRDTSSRNSPRIKINPDLHTAILRLTHLTWGD